MKVAVITVSDRASRGEYQDLSGPAMIDILKEVFRDELEISSFIVPDEEAALTEAFEAAVAGDRPADAILTTGGTGIGPRDITPEVTAAWCEKELPGIAEMLRAESYKETSMAVLSRGYAGIRGSTVVVNFPGSVKAVTLCTRLTAPILSHATSMLAGGGH